MLINSTLIDSILSEPYQCGYLPERKARSEVLVPPDAIGETEFSALLRQGFRRNGFLTYRPNCAQCQRCISVRVDVKNFRFSKSQKRVLKKNQDLRQRLLPLEFHQEHFEMFKRYQTIVHKEPHDLPEQEKQYQRFILDSFVDSWLIEYRNKANELKIVSLCDFSDDGISAVYTFYQANDPNSLGTYSILQQINLCKTLDMPWLYLGFWVKNNHKMAYKLRFQPLQYLNDGVWQDASF